MFKFKLFRKITIETSQKNSKRSLSKSDTNVYNFLVRYFPTIDGNKAMIITEKIIEKGNIVALEQRLLRLKNELKSDNNTKNKNDVLNLLKTIVLPEHGYNF